MSTLVFLEAADDIGLQTLTFARRYDAQAEVVAFGEAPQVAATVHLADLDPYAPQAWARAIASLQPTTVIAAGTDVGNEVLAHAAVMLDGVLAANVVAAAGDQVTRQRWGGSLLEEARLHGAVKLMTLAPHT